MFTVGKSEEVLTESQRIDMSLWILGCRWLFLCFILTAMSRRVSGGSRGQEGLACDASEDEELLPTFDVLGRSCRSCRRHEGAGVAQAGYAALPFHGECRRHQDLSAVGQDSVRPSLPGHGGGH